MLTVGIHLQGMAEAQARGFAQAVHHRATLALVDAQAQHKHLGPLAEGIQYRGAGRAAGIVHQDARQIGGQQGLDHPGNGGFVVVDRDHRARVMHQLRSRAGSAHWSRWRWHCGR
ncbi:hypothetical protein D3C81_1927660 [compost metagenome]